MKNIALFVVFKQLRNWDPLYCFRSNSMVKTTLKQSNNPGFLSANKNKPKKGPTTTQQTKNTNKALEKNKNNEKQKNQNIGKKRVHMKNQIKNLTKKRIKIN